MQRRMVEPNTDASRAFPLVDAAGAPGSEGALRLDAVEAGGRLEGARSEDREWRELQRLCLEGKVDRVCDRELRVRRACLGTACLLAYFSWTVLIVAASDTSFGLTSQPFFRIHLPLLLTALLLLTGTVWGAFRIRRRWIQQQAMLLGIEVQVPTALQSRPREARQLVLPKPHSVEHLLQRRRAQAPENPGTGNGSTRGAG